MTMCDRPVRPIRSERDYTDALARIETLMDEVLMDRQRSPAGDDELDVLVTLVGVYEERRFPMDLPDPVEAIAFRMQQLGMNQSDLQPILGSRAKVSEVLAGKRTLTLKMIRALHAHLGIPAEVLIGDGGHPPRSPAGLDPDRFPVAEMVRRGWIGPAADRAGTAARIRALVTSAGGPDALPVARLRRGGGANAKTDLNALQAWCLHILGQARRAGLEGRYKPGTVDPAFLRTIARLSTLDAGPRLAKDALDRHGIALVVAAQLPKTYLDGAALRTVDGVPVVGMTIRHDRLDNFWFCLLHELAHIGRHFTDGHDTVFIDDLQLRERNHRHDDDREREADEWAQEALIPSALWNEHPARRHPAVRNVLSLAREADVHPAIVASRIRHERQNYRLLPRFAGSGVRVRCPD